ncbi:hypothetical protein MASR2M70_21550 [Bacillota bacterium]
MVANIKKKHRKIWIAVLAVVIILIIGAGIFYRMSEANLQRLALTEIPNVDLGQFEDGVYTGSYSAFPISVKVQVSLKNHKITEIIIREHLNGKGEAAEIIINDVIEAQSLEVDAITGATYSSKAILKAIEDALIGPGG